MVTGCTIKVVSAFCCSLRKSDEKTRIRTITFQGPVKTGNLFVHTAGID